MAWYWYAALGAIAIGVLDRLLNAKHKKPRGSSVATGPMVVMLGSKRKPQGSMPLELAPFLEALRGLASRPGGLGWARAEVRRIGEEIHAKHGHEAMVSVCDELSYVLGGGPAREVEVAWDGIGDWRG
jgi:hypothetical protein